MATPEDMGSVAEMIEELAAFEQAPAEARLSKEDLLLHGFGEHKRFECLVAQAESRVVGMALFYERFSTWKGPTLYLEDLYVREGFRSQGIGERLLAHLREITRAGGYARLEWQVLDWNSSALIFYERSGAIKDSGWVNMKFEGEQLA
jgi:GNAT superfamily N-acetyltransferase